MLMLTLKSFNFIIILIIYQNFYKSNSDIKRNQNLEQINYRLKTLESISKHFCINLYIKCRQIKEIKYLEYIKKVGKIAILFINMKISNPINISSIS